MKICNLLWVDDYDPKSLILCFPSHFTNAQILETAISQVVSQGWGREEALKAFAGGCEVPDHWTGILIKIADILEDSNIRFELEFHEFDPAIPYCA